MDKFKKTLDRINRRPVSKKRFEGATGVDFENSVKKEDLQSQYDSEQDVDKKKKIKQRAHLMGVSLE